MILKKYLVHAFLITLFLLIPIFSSPDLDARFTMLRVPAFQQEMLQTVLVIAFFYVNYFFIIPKFYDSKKLFWFVLLLIASYLIITFLPQIITEESLHQVRPYNRPARPMEPNGGVRNLSRSFLPFIFAFFSSFFLIKTSEKREIERAKAKADFLNLKYQLHPHFLFNVLNSIYSLSLMQSEATPESILKLSNIMRYVVEEIDHDYVPLSRELDYIRDYTALQLIRTDDTLQFLYNEDIPPNQLVIAPMILINYVENAFKFGFSAETKSYIDIHIRLVGNELNFVVKNAVVNGGMAEKSTGIGISNTSERLRQIYPGHHRISVSSDDSFYEVRLALNLDKNPVKKKDD